MSLILGTLSELKTHLLPEDLRADTRWDGVLTSLGRGVAERLQRACNRRFAYVVDDVFEFSADRGHVVLPRYPVVAVSKIEIRSSPTAAWQELTDVIQTANLDAGFLLFGADLGTHYDRVRITYTGGYWFDASADGSPGNVRSWQQGSVALSVNDESQAVTFSSAFAEIPLVDVSIAPPAGGLLITAAASEITTEGFTALLGFPIPASGYTLQWKASTSTALEVASGSPPTGSTARPADLYLAWLLQCEFVWKLRDKLGLGLAGDKADSTQLVSLSLAGLKLVPDVEETCRAYRRFAS